MNIHVCVFIHDGSEQALLAWQSFQWGGYLYRLDEAFFPQVRKIEG